MTDFLLSRCWPLLAGVAVKSLCVLALAAVAALALRPSSAAARHLVWRLALAGLLLLPVFSSLPAVWQVPLAPRVLLVTPDAPLVTDRPPAPNFGGAGAAPAKSLPTPPELGAGGRPPLPWPVWACALWLTGFVLTLLPSLLGLAGVGRLARRSSPVPDGPLRDLMTALSKELGVTAPLHLLTGDAGTPMTWGWLRPVVLLPVGADAWPEDRLRAVLLHELAHVARADWPAQMLSHLACALYWFNPAVWLAARWARLESERACDDRVLLAGVPAPDYARHLLDVARALNTQTLLAALPMVRTLQIENRITAILRRRQRGEVARAAARTCGLVLSTVLVLLAVLRLTPKPVVTTLMVDGVRVQAAAWQAIPPYKTGWMLSSTLKVSRTPDPRQHWELAITDQRVRWVQGLLLQANSWSGMVWARSLQHMGPTQCLSDIWLSSKPGRHAALYPTPGAYDDISGQLCRYETLDERVTFHDVHFIRTANGLWILSTPAPLSVTTPSGITMTLLPQPTDGYSLTSADMDKNVFTGWYKPGLHCWIQLSPDMYGPYVLSASPLCRTYHVPVTFRLLWPTGQLPLIPFQSANSKSYQLGVAVPLPPPAGGTLKSLTFVVRQRVDVQKFPLSFTVPLETRPWPVFPAPAPKKREQKGVVS